MRLLSQCPALCPRASCPRGRAAWGPPLPSGRHHHGRGRCQAALAVRQPKAPSPRAFLKPPWTPGLGRRQQRHRSAKGPTGWSLGSARVLGLQAAAPGGGQRRQLERRGLRRRLWFKGQRERRRVQSPERPTAATAPRRAQGSRVALPSWPRPLTCRGRARLASACAVSLGCLASQKDPVSRGPRAAR